MSSSCQQSTALDNGVPKGPCCKQYIEKLEKSAAGRRKLRQAITMLKDKLEATGNVLQVNEMLRQECEKERQRAEAEKKHAEEETKLRQKVEKDGVYVKEQLIHVLQRLDIVEKKCKADHDKVVRLHSEMREVVSELGGAVKAVEAAHTSFENLEKSLFAKVDSAVMETSKASFLAQSANEDANAAKVLITTVEKSCSVLVAQVAALERQVTRFDQQVSCLKHPHTGSPDLLKDIVCETLDVGKQCKTKIGENNKIVIERSILCEPQVVPSNLKSPSNDDVIAQQNQNFVLIPSSGSNERRSVERTGTLGSVKQKPLATGDLDLLKDEGCELLDVGKQCNARIAENNPKTIERNILGESQIVPSNLKNPSDDNQNYVRIPCSGSNQRHYAERTSNLGSVKQKNTRTDNYDRNIETPAIQVVASNQVSRPEGTSILAQKKVISSRIPLESSAGSGKRQSMTLPDRNVVREALEAARLRKAAVPLSGGLNGSTAAICQPVIAPNNTKKIEDSSQAQVKFNNVGILPMGCSGTGKRQLVDRSRVLEALNDLKAMIGISNANIIQVSVERKVTLPRELANDSDAVQVANNQGELSAVPLATDPNSSEGATDMLVGIMGEVTRDSESLGMDSDTEVFHRQERGGWDSNSDSDSDSDFSGYGLEDNWWETKRVLLSPNLPKVLPPSPSKLSLCKSPSNHVFLDVEQE